MKIYENRKQNKRITHCPTCGNEGHMWMTCPVPAIQLELKKQGKEPDASLYSPWFQTTFSKRDTTGKLIYEDRIWAKCAVELLKQENRRDRHKTKKRRTLKKSCGFCGTTGHNRRNCEIMDNFINDLSRTNQNFRKKFYEKIVKELGLAEGALLSLTGSGYMKGSYVDNYSGIGIVTSIDWSSINLGLSQDSWEYRTEFVIEVLIDGDTYTLQNPLKGMVKNADQKMAEFPNFFGRRGSHWGLAIAEIIAPSDNIPSEEWFNHGYEDCWKWITKNRPLSGISSHLSPVIAEWHPSRRGRNAGKLNHRLAQYGYRKV